MTVDMGARYAVAESLLAHKLKELIDSPQVRPIWIDGTETFWYIKTTKAGKEFVLVDAEAGTKRAAFDHARLANALEKVLEIPVEATALPIPGFELRDGSVRLTALGKRIEVSLDSYEPRVLGAAYDAELPSPDGRWSVGVEAFNLFIRDLQTGEVRQLTTDGTESVGYGKMPDFAGRVMQENLGFTMPPLVLWSPDSSKFVTYRLDQSNVGMMHLLRAVPFEGIRPKPMAYRYALPGDPDETLATSTYHIFEAATGAVTAAKKEPVLTPFVPPVAYNYVWWNDDGTKVFFINSDRGDKNFWLNELDVATGDVQVIHHETSTTHITLGAQHQYREARVLDSTGEILWWSQRDGWGHLYLHGRNGEVRALTSGEWQVRQIVSVDEQARTVLFSAAGRLPGSDLYMAELASVSLDGGEIVTITEDGLDHELAPSDSGRYFVDITSRFDTPAVSVLRDRTGTIVMELERADATALYATGWTPAERVVVKAADGVTDIYCSIYKPHDFDPTKTYPVVNEVYPGPQISMTPLRFPLSDGLMLTGEKHLATFAALGFVGVAVDVRGGALRSKTFQDHTRLVRDGDNVDDLVAAIQQLAATRPWMDLERVGIFGHSAGAYFSTRAMLLRPDFFKVAVSSSGDHDDRINHAWWSEKFFGLTDEFDYVDHSNTTHADKLEGKLFLIHGEMDDNAVPHGTMRLVDALIAANKDFDLLIVPNAEHGLNQHRNYFIRRRWDFFVENLLGETKPKYRVDDVPIAKPGE